MAKIKMGKVPMPKMGKSAPMPGGGGGAKPHIRMRKMKAVPPSAFPTAPMAFPPVGGPLAPDAGGMGPAPGQAMAAPPEGMSAGPGPGDAMG